MRTPDPLHAIQIQPIARGGGMRLHQQPQSLHVAPRLGRAPRAASTRWRIQDCPDYRTCRREYARKQRIKIL